MSKLFSKTAWISIETPPPNGKDVWLYNPKAPWPVPGYYSTHLKAFTVHTSGFKANVPPPTYISAEWEYDVKDIVGWSELLLPAK
jgi:hypothetical protein